MKRFQFFGMTCLSAAMFASGCVGEDQIDYSNDIAAMNRWIENFNGTEPNGAKLNGAKLNGAKLNGAKLNGASLSDMNIAAEGATLVGFVLESGAVLRGANFFPSKLSAVMENGEERDVRVVDWKQVTVPGLDPIDYYMVKDLDTNQSICGVDENNQPVWAMPLNRTFDQYNGKAVTRVNQFSFNTKV